MGFYGRAQVCMMLLLVRVRRCMLLLVVVVFLSGSLLNLYRVSQSHQRQQRRSVVVIFSTWTWCLHLPFF